MKNTRSIDQKKARRVSFPVVALSTTAGLAVYREAALRENGDTELSSMIDQIMAGIKRASGPDGIAWVPDGIHMKIIRDSRRYVARLRARAM